MFEQFEEIFKAKQSSPVGTKNTKFKVVATGTSSIAVQIVE